MILIDEKRLRLGLQFQLLAREDIHLLHEHLLETDVGAIAELGEATAALAFEDDVRLAPDEDAVRRS